MNRKDFLKAAAGVIAAPFVVKDVKSDPVKFSQSISEITQGKQIYIKGSDLNIVTSTPRFRHLFDHDPNTFLLNTPINQNFIRTSKAVDEYGDEMLKNKFQDMINDEP